MATFVQAFKACPACISYDTVGFGETVEGLVDQAAFQLQLYREGETSDIETSREAASVQRFIKKYKARA